MFKKLERFLATTPKIWFLLLVLLVAAILRLYALDKLPPSLYWEEVALGYDAFSILRTGKDHHGHILPLVAFKSFGDWKPSGYFYSLVPFVAVFGLSSWAVRLPSALAGVMTVLGVWMLAKLWLESWQQKLSDVDRALWSWLPIVTAAVTAVSPWMILFSRAGLEVNLATSFLVWGVVFGIMATTWSRLLWVGWITATVLLIFSMYTYHSCRILAPLLGLGLVINWVQRTTFSQWFKTYKRLVLSLLGLCIILLLPFIVVIGQPQLSQRFNETSIFNDLSLIQESNQRVAASSFPRIAKVFYHRYVLFSRQIMENYLSHFNLDFLFISGDTNARHSIQYMGQLYHIEALFLFIGIYFWFKRSSPISLLLFFWLLMGILPAALTTAVPHALRILPVVPVIMILIGVGIIGCLQLCLTAISSVRSSFGYTFSKRTHMGGVVLFILLLYGIEVGMFWRYYTRIYPRLTTQDWQYGYAQLVPELQRLSLEYPNLPFFVSREIGRPAMYYWFYTQTDPRQVQALTNNAPFDQGEALTFNQFYFIRGFEDVPTSPALVALSASSYARLSELGIFPTTLVTISDLANQPLWKIGIVK